MWHLDVAGSAILTEILKEMQLLNVKVYLANPMDRVYDTLVHSMALGEGPFEILPTLHDAVLYARSIDNSWSLFLRKVETDNVYILYIFLQEHKIMSNYSNRITQSA